MEGETLRPAAAQRDAKIPRRYRQKKGPDDVRPARGGKREEEAAGLEMLDVQLLEQLLEDLAGLELDHGALGNDDLGLGLVRVATDPRLALLNLKDAEVAQLYVTTFGQSLHDDVEGHLNRRDNFLLGEACLLVNFQNDFAFREIR
jgi:hypothetical protein